MSEARKTLTTSTSELKCTVCTCTYMYTCKCKVDGKLEFVLKSPIFDYHKTGVQCTCTCKYMQVHVHTGTHRIIWYNRYM